MEIKETKTKQTAESGEKKQKKKPGFFRRMFSLLVILVLVLSAAALSAMEDGNHFTSLRRWLMYGESEHQL